MAYSMNGVILPRSCTTVIHPALRSTRYAYRFRHPLLRVEFAGLRASLHYRSNFAGQLGCVKRGDAINCANRGGIFRAVTPEFGTYHSPFISRVHVVATSAPSGVTIPNPVTTTRRCGRFFGGGNSELYLIFNNFLDLFLFLSSDRTYHWR